MPTNAADAVRDLIKVGVTVKDNLQKLFNGKPIDWKVFADSATYEQARKSIEAIVKPLTDSVLNDTIAAIEKKMEDIRGGKPLSALSTEQLIQYSDLSDLRVLLAGRKVKIAADGGFARWVVEEVLPWLAKNAPPLIALLT